MEGKAYQDRGIQSTSGGTDSAPRILIVEDEQIVAADIRNRLTTLGYTSTAVATSTDEAMQRAEEIHPDLLLIDIILRGSVDGIEAARLLRSKMDIPVIYLTAYTDEQLVRRAKETEPFAYLLKPYDERELGFAIELALYRHQIERRLREREERFRQLADTPADATWLLDAATGNLLYMSPGAEPIWGRHPRELASGSIAWLDPIHADDRQRVAGLIERATAGQIDDRGLEYRIIRPDGSHRWVLTRAYPVIDSTGSVYRIVGTTRDITREKWTWDTLRESEERYRLMADHATDLISRHSPEGIYLYASPASKSLLGYRPEELLGTSAYGYLHPADAELIRSRDLDAGHYLASGTERYRIRRKDGTYIWFETTSRTVRDPVTSELREVTAVSRDISERTQAEEILHRYEFIANSSLEFMSLINRSYIYEAANDAYCKVHGRSRDAIVGQTVSSLWGEETFRDVIKQHLDECFTGKGVRYESWFTFGSQEPRFYEVNCYPYRNQQGEVTHSVVVSHDISKRKSAEDQLHSSLREKEVLLKEIHHRVKNNLQIISSLLNLQTSTIQDDATRELIRESQNRVRSMALIHEKLYQSASLARIDFGEYLRNLTRDLFRSYSAGGVTLKLQAEDIHLDVDTAIPCGLIITELVSNALKYAFPQGQGGELLITFARIARDKYALSVTDNGTGLPRAVDFRSPKTLGLQLVNMLISQLRGTLDVVSDGGTTFMITFTTEREAAAKAVH